MNRLVPPKYVGAIFPVISHQLDRICCLIPSYMFLVIFVAAHYLCETGHVKWKSHTHKLLGN